MLSIIQLSSQEKQSALYILCSVPFPGSFSQAFALRSENWGNDASNILFTLKLATQYYSISVVIANNESKLKAEQTTVLVHYS